MNNKIPFNKPCLGGNEFEYISDAISRGKIAGDGHYNTLCHKEIARELGAKKVLLTSSCTDALELAALLIGLEPGDEFILPSFTFVSTATAFCLRGARPVFVDIRPDTLNLDEDQIESAITDRTKAIVPVHYAGVACEMDKICDIAGRYDLNVVEDAAQGFLATYKGKHLGTFGRAGCFSFHETKTLISGEGGAIVVNREEDIEKVEILREKGTNRSAFFRGDVNKYTWVGLGSSFLPSEMIGAFLYGQWCARDQILTVREKIYNNYQNLLQPLIERGLITMTRIPKECRVNYHMFPLLVESEKIQKRLLEYLFERGIYAVRHYVPLHNSPYAQKMGISAKLPMTEDVAERLIRLPFYNSLSMSEQRHIAECIENYFGI